MHQDELMERLHPNATRIIIAEARRWRVEPDAYEDIVQKTFLKMVRYPMDLSVARNADNLFLSAAKRVAQQVLYTYRGFRSNGKVTGVSEAKRATWPAGLFQTPDKEGANVLDDRMLPRMPSAEDAYFRDHRFEALWEAVGGLSELQATCISLRYREELSVAEIALKLDITEQKVNWTVAEGLRKLRRRMNPGQKSYASGKLNENRKVHA